MKIALWILAILMAMLSFTPFGFLESQQADAVPSSVDPVNWLIISDKLGIELTGGQGARSTALQGQLWVRTNQGTWVHVELLHTTRVLPLH